MEPLEFDWDDTTVKHLARHGVVPRQAEHVLLHEAIDLGTELVNGEEPYASLGASAKGRVLVVVTTWRRDWLRVVTAFEPGRKLVRLFYLGRCWQKRNFPSRQTRKRRRGGSNIKASSPSGLRKLARERQRGASPTITIRLPEEDLARALAAAKGLRYQTYIKMLLHQALDLDEGPAAH